MVYQKNTDATRALLELRCNPPDVQMILLLLLACEPAVERKCWGDRLVDISPGEGTYCMVDNEGCMECRYYNKESESQTHVPVDPLPEGKFQSVFLTEFSLAERGAVAGCAIDTDGHPHCWEPEEKNQWGESSPDPTETVTMIANHGRAPCAARAEGGAYCWGGGGRSLDSDVVFKDISVNTLDDSRLGLSEDGTLYSWMPSLRWGIDSLPGSFVALDGVHDTCALDSERGLVCWDWVEGWEAPFLVDPSVQGTVLCYGSYAGCVLRDDGAVTCMKEGLTPEFDVPLVTLKCAGLSDWGTLCGLTESGEGRCWSEEKGMWKLP